MPTKLYKPFYLFAMNLKSLLKTLKFQTGVYIIFMTIWYCLSSEYTYGFLIMGTVSCWLTLILSIRLRVMKQSGDLTYRGVFRIIAYYFWIVKEVVKASIDVSKRIWSPNGASYSGFCRIEIPKTNHIGMVAFANSITLTPGTISVYLKKNILIVHTLDTSLEENLRRDSGKIIERVNKLIKYNNKDKKC